MSGRASAYPPTTQSYKRKLWDGYELSLGPAANSTVEGDNCTAAIYNKEGHVVYRTTGFNVTFVEDLTGQDFDGDGHGEVVFETDTAGGNHCCWSYNVISLFPKPHKLFDIDEEGAVQFERDASGKMVIWKRVAAPDVLKSKSHDPCLSAPINTHSAGNSMKPSPISTSGPRRRAHR